ncbi:MAG TPA: PKD-like family lipoprotein [Mucilaginibacter sp.]|nr:PKD-like family lipoprotein [Mucilaginibacter sp.]
MKFHKIFLLPLFILAIFTYGCKKDLGNYSYRQLADPDVRDLDGKTFPAVEGDSLILKPAITYPGGDVSKDLTFNWRITYLEKQTAENYTGYPLRIIYNLPPGSRPVRLTITVKATGVQYFYNFKILGGTQYSLGNAVLSVDNGVTRLSFVQPDNKTIQSNIYSTLNKEDLPSNPVQLFAKHSPANYGPLTLQQYWIMCNDPAKGSVIVDATTMLKVSDFGKQFLSPPNTIVPGHIEDSTGVADGVINGKFYRGTTNTAPFAPDYGKYGNPQPGNYTMSPYFTQTYGYTFGYNEVAGAFISFDGGGNYNGTDYQVTGDAFDPTNTGLHNLLFMQAVSGTSYAFLKDSQGAIFELSFKLDIDDYNNRAIDPLVKRPFAGASLVTPETKWQRSVVDVFYFSSHNVIYRYNPINQSLKALNTNFNGDITMLKLSSDGNELTVGIKGSIYFLDVSIGKDGSTTTQPTITGIPGEPVDMVTLK